MYSTFSFNNPAVKSSTQKLTLKDWMSSMIWKTVRECTALPSQPSQTGMNMIKCSADFQSARSPGLCECKPPILWTASFCTLSIKLRSVQICDHSVEIPQIVLDGLKVVLHMGLNATCSEARGNNMIIHFLRSAFNAQILGAKTPSFLNQTVEWSRALRSHWGLQDCTLFQVHMAITNSSCFCLKI